MPLGNDVGENMHELAMDNKKSGKERGANGKVRSRKQMIAIALQAAGKSKMPSGMEAVKRRMMKKGGM